MIQSEQINKESVMCPKCKKTLDVRRGWWDRFQKSYVHYECLSKERLAEITNHDKYLV